MKKAIQEKIKSLEAEIISLNAQLIAIDSSIEANVYQSLNDAKDFITERFQRIAEDACEGSYRYGDSEYKQLFMVDGKTYEATVSFEYNRHDKTYYYVDGTDYSFKEVAA